MDGLDEGANGIDAGEPRQRADARRNVLAVLDAANALFAEAGIDVPMRDIAQRAGVGIGTIYRHFPTRADLIAAVFRAEIDACADAAVALAANHPPFTALALWMQRLVALAATKQGLAGALHSGDPAFDALPARREQRLRAAVQHLYDRALAAGAIGDAITAPELLDAAATLCMAAGPRQPDRAGRLVALLVEGLRRDSDGGAGGPRPAQPTD